MPITDTTPDALDAAAAPVRAGDRPIFMLNLLRYNARACYIDRDGFAPCSGREVYFQPYVLAFGKLAEGTGIGPFRIGTWWRASSPPPGEQWDDVAIVE